VNRITVTAIGAAGGASCDTSALAGEGASVTATISVTPNETLYVGVGGAGGTGCTSGGTGGAGGSGGGASGGAGAPDGGGGGGASGVGLTSLAAGSSPLIVAGGGGGAAVCSGSGGNAGSAGTGGSSCASDFGRGGGAGTTTAGGAGGAVTVSGGTAGSAGTAGNGGAGGASISGPAGGGGGGGGGYYGGGGGGGGGFVSGGGGGGGGSSFTAAGATAVSGPTPTTASASVTISYTAQPAPVVKTGKASSVGTTSARLHGSVNTEGLNTTYYFQYGTSKSYGKSTAKHALKPGTSAKSVSALLKHLKPGHTYHYRLVATNASGTTQGKDMTFTTRTPASIHVRPSTVHSGHTVRVFGSAGLCLAGDRVTLLSRAFGNAHSFAGVPAVYATVNSKGNYSTTAKIPASKAAGSYTVTGRCGGGTLGVSATLHVLSAAPSFTG
jgi:hypothetical protein